MQLELFPEYSGEIFSSGCFNDKRLEKRGSSYFQVS